LFIEKDSHYLQSARYCEWFSHANKKTLFLTIFLPPCAAPDTEPQIDGERDMKATIWHNPDCGTSRKTLAILQDTPGVEVSVIEYRKTPFSRDKLEQLFQAAGLSPREALRTRGSPAEELGLIDGASADTILDAMVGNAILVERPFVETEKGVRLCRPQEKVIEIL
jgi:arsenate reductase (glutaredoxin)